MARRGSSLLVGPAAALLAALAGCAQLAPGRAVPECPGALVASEAIPEGLRLRERWSVRRGDATFPLEVVAQARAGELVVVGLHPLGAKLFALRQRGLAVEVEASAPAPVLEVPPGNVLRDLHRARFLAVAAPGADGSFSERRDGTEIRELRAAGRVVERSFQRVAGDPPGRVVLRFSEPAAGAQAPSVELENGWCGYAASLAPLAAKGAR